LHVQEFSLAFSDEPRQLALWILVHRLLRFCM